MAITDAYATAAEYRAGANKDDTSEDADILLDLTAMSRYLERRIGMFFTKDAAAVLRVYDPRVAGATLETDPIVSVTSIKVDADRDGSFADSTAWATTDYELLPRNAALGPEVKPYDRIFIPAWSTQPLFTPGTRVQVEAVFGWAAVPEAIKRATIHLTAFLRLETPAAARSVIDTGELIEASPHMRSIITNLMREYAGTVVL